MLSFIDLDPRRKLSKTEWRAQSIRHRGRGLSVLLPTAAEAVTNTTAARIFRSRTKIRIPSIEGTTSCANCAKSAPKFGLPPTDASHPQCSSRLRGLARDIVGGNPIASPNRRIAPASPRIALQPVRR